MNDRQLDALIDQKFFNILRFTGPGIVDLGSDDTICPFYTSKISDSWKVVEKLYELGYLVSIEQIFHDGFNDNKAYQVTLVAYNLSRISENMNRGLIMGIAPSASQAIGTAALKAIEINATAIIAQKEMDKKHV